MGSVRGGGGQGLLDAIHVLIFYLGGYNMHGLTFLYVCDTVLKETRAINDSLSSPAEDNPKASRRQYQTLQDQSLVYPYSSSSFPSLPAVTQLNQPPFSSAA